MKKEFKNLFMLGATTLINQTPNIIENVGKKKEDNFLDKNKSWISVILLTIL